MKLQTLGVKRQTSNIKLQTVLVTGGAGFIGSHLVDRLIEKGHEVLIIDNLSTGKKENLNPAYFVGTGPKAKFYEIDIQDPGISGIFKKEKPDVVFHYAAQIDVRKSVEDPIGDAKINILGSLNLIQNFVQVKQRINPRQSIPGNKFIFASSGGAIYGDSSVIPTPENFSLNPQSPYGVAKLTIEKYLDFYNKAYGLDYVALRYSNVYGPRQDSRGEAGVVAIFIDKLLHKQVPTIFGSGEQTRDFVFVKDAVDAALKALDLLLSGKSAVFNVGTNKETSINTLYSLILEKTGKSAQPNFAPSKIGDIKRSCLDCSKIKKELGWYPQYSLDQGLSKTVKWFTP